MPTCPLSISLNLPLLFVQIKRVRVRVREWRRVSRYNVPMFYTSQSPMTVLIHFHEVVLSLQTSHCCLWKNRARARRSWNWMSPPEYTTWQWFNLLLTSLSGWNAIEFRAFLLLFPNHNKNCVAFETREIGFEILAPSHNKQNTALFWYVILVSTNLFPSLTLFQHCNDWCDTEAICHNEMFWVLWFGCNLHQHLARNTMVFDWINANKRHWLQLTFRCMWWK